MKRIYIILTYSGTLVSRIVKFYTKRPYSHASIALDEGLDKMYSFGRLHPYNTFIAGLVHEKIYSGTFNRFKNTRAAIYWIEVTDEQFDQMKKVIEHMYINRKKYKFNMIGLFLVSLNKRRIKKNFFYCAEFVRHVLQSAGIGKDLPEIIKPEDFKMLDGISIKYEGLLRSYNGSKIVLEK